METTAWQSEQLELNTTPQNGHDGTADASNSLATLKELTLRLLREVQCIGEVQTFRFEDGLDFYDEVSRFEINLIKRALLQTAGHQTRAASLLNLRVTTLNSKIKHYGISLNDILIGYPLLQTSDNANRQLGYRSGSTGLGSLL